VSSATPWRQQTRRSAPTPDDGSYAVTDLRPGRWQLTLDGTDLGALPPTIATVFAGAPVALDLHTLPRLTIEGRATLSDDQPAADVAITAQQDDRFIGGTRTRNDGTFKLAALPPGICELSVEPFSGDLGLPAPVRAAAGTTGVELHLQPTFGSIRGVLTDGGDAWVMARRRGSDDAIGNRCDLDGAFRCDGLRMGTWDVTAQGRRGNVAVISALVVLPGRVTTAVTGALAPGALLRPHCDTADEFVVANRDTVAAADNLQRGVPGEATVPPGPWTIVFRRAGAEVARREVRVQAGEVAAVEAR